MTEMANTDDLKAAIEGQHGGIATYRQSVPVDERHGGRPVWQRTVNVFDLAGHSLASTAYAWSSPVDGSDRRRFFAVLHIPPIDSPLAAVRAAIVAEQRAKG